MLKSISERHKLEPSGDPSLQNSIEMAKSSMRFVETKSHSRRLTFHTSHLPTHSSREILIIFGSLTTCDPGNIHDTLDSCVKDKIRISVVALAAEMKICRDLCDKTGGECSSTASPLLPLLITIGRSIWCRDERRSLQRSVVRTHSTSGPARCCTSCGNYEPGG